MCKRDGRASVDIASRENSVRHEVTRWSTETFESESVMPRIRVGGGYDPTQGCPGIEGGRRLAPAARAVAIARVVAGPEAGAVIVLVRVARSIRAIEPLVCLAIIAMTNGIVAAALLTIVLRMPEP